MSEFIPLIGLISKVIPLEVIFRHGLPVFSHYCAPYVDSLLRGENLCKKASAISCPLYKISYFKTLLVFSKSGEVKIY